MKPVTVWAVRYGHGGIDLTSIRGARRDAIKAFCNYPTARWDFWRKKHGCRAVRVRLVVEGGEDE